MSFMAFRAFQEMGKKWFGQQHNVATGGRFSIPRTPLFAKSWQKKNRLHFAVAVVCDIPTQSMVGHVPRTDPSANAQLACLPAAIPELLTSREIKRYHFDFLRCRILRLTTTATTTVDESKQSPRNLSSSPSPSTGFQTATVTLQHLNRESGENGEKERNWKLNGCVGTEAPCETCAFPTRGGPFQPSAIFSLPVLTDLPVKNGAL